MSNPGNRGTHRERGFALLITLLVLVIGSTALFLAASDPLAERKAARPGIAAASVAEARELVLARALVDMNRPGSISCAAPDEGGSGTFDGDDCEVSIGRFPYRTLDNPPQRDAGGALLWYALDPALRDRASQEPINPEEKPGGLSVDGEGSYAAVIIAPGDALEGQNRATGARADFLEGDNASGNDFVDCTGNPDCNDIVRGISINRLFHSVQRRVLAGVERALANVEARTGSLPWASAWGDASMGCETDRLRGRLPRSTGDCTGTAPYVRDSDYAAGDEWIVENGWDSLVVYEVASQCSPDEANCGNGGLALDAESGLDAVLGAAGRAFSGQVRPGADIDDYLDHSDNRDADGSYRDAALSATDNDVFRGVRISP